VRHDVRFTSRCAIVVVEEPTKTLTSTNATAAIIHHGRGINQSVSDALMIPLAVIVLDEFANGATDVTSAQRERPSSLPTP